MGRERERSITGQDCLSFPGVHHRLVPMPRGDHDREPDSFET